MPVEGKREIFLNVFFFFFPISFFSVLLLERIRRRKCWKRNSYLRTSVICSLPGDLVGSWRTCLVIIFFFLLLLCWAIVSSGNGPSLSLPFELGVVLRSLWCGRARARIVICNHFCFETAKPQHLLLEAEWVAGLGETDKHNGLFKQKEKTCLSRACAISMNYIIGCWQWLGSQLFVLPSSHRFGGRIFGDWLLILLSDFTSLERKLTYRKLNEILLVTGTERTLIQNFCVIQNTRKQIKWQAMDWGEKKIFPTHTTEKKAHFFFFEMHKQLLNWS